MKLHAPCSMLRLRPHYLLRLQNNHNVPFNNGEQEEALTILQHKYKKIHNYCNARFYLFFLFDFLYNIQFLIMQCLAIFIKTKIEKKKKL